MSRITGSKIERDYFLKTAAPRKQAFADAFGHYDPKLGRYVLSNAEYRARHRVVYTEWLNREGAGRGKISTAQYRGIVLEGQAECAKKVKAQAFTIERQKKEIIDLTNGGPRDDTVQVKEEPTELVDIQKQAQELVPPLESSSDTDPKSIDLPVQLEKSLENYSQTMRNEKQKVKLKPYVDGDVHTLTRNNSVKMNIAPIQNEEKPPPIQRRKRRNGITRSDAVKRPTDKSSIDSPVRLNESLENYSRNRRPKIVPEIQNENPEDSESDSETFDSNPNDSNTSTDNDVSEDSEDSLPPLPLSDSESSDEESSDEESSDEVIEEEPTLPLTATNRVLFERRANGGIPEERFSETVTRLIRKRKGTFNRQGRNVRFKLVEYAVSEEKSFPVTERYTEKYPVISVVPSQSSTTSRVTIYREPTDEDNIRLVTAMEDVDNSAVINIRKLQKRHPFRSQLFKNIDDVSLFRIVFQSPQRTEAWLEDIISNVDLQEPDVETELMSVVQMATFARNMGLLAQGNISECETKVMELKDNQREDLETYIKSRQQQIKGYENIFDTLEGCDLLLAVFTGENSYMNQNTRNIPTLSKVSENFDNPESLFESCIESVKESTKISAGSMIGAAMGVIIAGTSLTYGGLPNTLNPTEVATVIKSDCAVFAAALASNITPTPYLARLMQVGENPDIVDTDLVEVFLNPPAQVGNDLLVKTDVTWSIPSNSTDKSQSLEKVVSNAYTSNQTIYDKYADYRQHLSDTYTGEGISSIVPGMLDENIDKAIEWLHNTLTAAKFKNILLGVTSTMRKYVSETNDKIIKMEHTGILRFQSPLYSIETIGTSIQDAKLHCISDIVVHYMKQAVIPDVVNSVSATF